ncbi:hypothetical protein LTS15_000208 [Exophiala xenobiotica]|nr:hypothetical protein LTS15_000208 [Exophiala xenobiotica]
MTLWYHVHSMKSGDLTTTLRKMKFLLSNVPTPDAGTYSDAHEIDLQEFGNRHPESDSTSKQNTGMLNPEPPAESLEGLTKKPEWKA